MPDPEPARKPASESMLASSSLDKTPQIGIVLSSFRGGAEHDGTPIAGLKEPCPADAALSAAQADALLRKAVDLARNRRRGGIPAGPDDWVVLKVHERADIRLVRSVLAMLLESKRGRRFSIATTVAPTAGYTSLLRELAVKYKGVRLEQVNLETDAYLEVPAVRRTFAAKNPQGVYAIPKTIRECDQLITIGPLAMNPLTGIGLSVSQYWDIAPRAVYGERREKLMALGDPVDVLTDLYLHQPASYAILGGAEHWDGMGRAVRHNIVIAGANAIAVDAVGAAVMGMNAAKIPLLDKLEIRGFGVAATDAIWTHGNEIEEARKAMEPPPGWRQA